MDDTFNQAVAAAIIIAPFVIAICQLAKRWVAERWSPIVAMVSGVALACLGALASDADDVPGPGELGFDSGPAIARTLLCGIAAGLIASGAYSQVKRLTDPA